jgi:hypothetical protein
VCGDSQNGQFLYGASIEKHASSLHDGGGCSMVEAEAWCRKSDSGLLAPKFEQKI